MDIQELMQDFQSKYERKGNKDLLYQVAYLSKLAKKYQDEDDWASLLRAHALYNSCVVRDAQGSRQWQEKVFEIQVKYWQAAPQSYFQHLQLTHSLKRQLQDIRDRWRKHLLIIAEHFNDLDCEPDKLECPTNQRHYAHILEDIPHTSRSVNQDMIALTESIVEKALAICGPPVCQYCVVALGSMARGEATPYSDLEFMFLIESCSDAVVGYFERLAVTMYFIIGNLRETKLKVMAIPELMTWDGAKQRFVAHWFDDAIMSGFKVDGLGSWAGNIPTGGTKEQSNQFICTVEDIAKRYKTVLDNPDSKESLAGDLTAMLANTAFVFGCQDLHDKLRSAINSYKPNELRKAATLSMFTRDVSKFDFRPTADLTHTRQLKPDIYRYPSLLILDLKIVYDIASCDPWEIICSLESKGVISTLAAECLRFSFSCALFIRLSAYLYHDSQNDSISVLSCIAGESLYKGAWYVPQALLVHMFIHLVPLKEAFSGAELGLGQMVTVEITRPSRLETVAQVRYHCGEHHGVLSVLKARHTDGLESADPFIQKIFIASAIRCREFAEAERLLIWRIQSDNYDNYDYSLLAGLHYYQDHLAQALDAYLTRAAILFSLHGFTDRKAIAQAFCSVAAASLKQGNYTEALGEYEQHLERYHTDLANVLCNVGVILWKLSLYDEALVEYNKCLDSYSRAFRGSQHIHISDVHCNIGAVFHRQSRYTEALVELHKCLDMRQKIYGHRDHLDIAEVLGSIGAVLHDQGKLVEALEKYRNCLWMRKRIHGGRDHERIAEMLNKTATALRDQGKFCEALVEYKSGLAMYQRLYTNNDHLKIAKMIGNIGVVLCLLKEHEEAVVECRKCLDMMHRVYDGRDHVDIVEALSNIGFTLSEKGEHGQALAEFRRSLEMLVRIFGDVDHPSISLVRENIAEVEDLLPSSSRL